MSDPAQAWQGLLDGLAQAGRTVERLEGRVPPIDIAEGYRYVLHLLADQLDRSALRASNHPLFLPAVSPTRKLLFDNPDAHYDVAAIRGDRRYRITGRRGDVTYLAFCVYAGDGDGGNGAGTRVANLADVDIDVASDGTFEVRLSADEQPGNWIPLAPDAHTVIARQYVTDPRTQTPAAYVIEADDQAGAEQRIGPGIEAAHRADPPLDADGFARAASRAAMFVTSMTALAGRRADDARRRPNQFVHISGHGVYGTPDASYVVCWYSLGPDEALVVDVRPPRCRYWGVHLANRWGQSLDHRTRTTSLNVASAVASASGDGSVLIVVAPDDPGGANWLDTAGHPEGWVLFRWLLADSVSVPDVRVVRRAELGDAAAEMTDA